MGGYSLAFLPPPPPFTQLTQLLLLSLFMGRVNQDKPKNFALLIQLLKPVQGGCSVQGALRGLLEDTKVSDCFCLSGETGLMGEVDTCNCSRAGDDKGHNIVQAQPGSLCKQHSETEPHMWTCHISFLNCTCLTLHLPELDQNVFSSKILESKMYCDN